MGQQGCLEAVLLRVAHLDPTAANSTEAEGRDECSPTWATSTNPTVRLTLQYVSEECHHALLMEQAQRKKRKRKINATESMHLITILSILPSFIKYNHCSCKNEDLTPEHHAQKAVFDLFHISANTLILVSTTPLCYLALLANNNNRFSY